MFHRYGAGRLENKAGQHEPGDHSKLNDKHVINTVYENYRNLLSANIAYHLHLKDVAEKGGDLEEMMHHQVMSKVYQATREMMYYSGSPLQ